MRGPARPENVRIVYPNGKIIPVVELAYRGKVNGRHIWQVTEPRWVPWNLDAKVEFDPIDGKHLIVPGWDIETWE